MAGNDTVNGDAGNDNLNGNTGNDSVFGGDGDDTVRGGQDNDSVFGDAGNDWVTGELGNDQVFGGLGIDTLRGGQGDDIVNGEDGDDYILGDRGNDTLTGGSGADDFIFEQGKEGHDLVTDFVQGVDDLAFDVDLLGPINAPTGATFNGVSFFDLEDILAISTNVDTNNDSVVDAMKITFNAQTSITVKNITTDSVLFSDFLIY